MSRRVTEERLERIESSLRDITEALERIQLMFMLKDPSSTSSAEAYEGLRRSVVLAREDQMSRRVELARVDAAATSRTTTAELRTLLDELLAGAGVERVVDFDQAPEQFEVFAADGTDLAHASLDVHEPAYIHSATGVLVRPGRATAQAAFDPPAGPPEGLRGPASTDSNDPAEKVSPDNAQDQETTT